VGVLLPSGTNSYVEPGLLVQDVQPSNWDKKVNFSHVEFTTSTYATHQYDRQFYEWAAVDFSESSHEHSYVNVRYHFPFRLHRDTWEDDQFHALSGEHVQIHPEKESSGLENAFGILLWQQMHCLRKIHAWNAYHNIWYGKTVPVTGAEQEVATWICLAWLSTQGWTCAVYRYCITLNGYSTWNHMETTFFLCHDLCNHSTLHTGVFVYINVI